jgi:6-phosphofructokinase 1
MPNKSIGILTGGGDVSPLNTVLSAARRSAIHSGFELIGFLKGWQGVLEKTYISLRDLPVDPAIGGTILKSSRVSLQAIPHAAEHVQRNCREIGLQGLIVVGGEDTLSNCFGVNDPPQVLISKTIDNDVGVMNRGDRIEPEDIINYFTLGYPTAAAKISSFVSLSEGLRTTAYSHERVIVVESMGMHAGWLALSSGMGHPDFIIIPEFPIDYDRFKDAVIERYGRQRHVIIVAAEGARWSDGSYISADEEEKDDFGHPRFRGAGETLAQRLKADLKPFFDTRNVNAVNPSYLYRSGKPCELDLQWAQTLGRKAVEICVDGVDENVFLGVERENSGFRPAAYPLSRFDDIQALHRFVDARFYDPETYSMTDQAGSYLSAILEEMPPHRGYGIRL